MRDRLSQIRSAFDALSPRERLLLLAVGLLVALALVFLIVVQPLLAVAARSEERLAAADQQLHVMQRLRRDYDDIQHRLAAVERRIESSARGNLRTTLETLARQAAVQVESMEPQLSPQHEAYRETKVEVGLQEVTLAQTVNYLHHIESAPQALSVKSLRMRTRPERPELLDVTFTVSSFEPVE